MKAELIAHDGEELTLQVKVKITGSLFEAEQAILDACNEVGQLATLHAIKRFDTDGSPIQVGGSWKNIPLNSAWIFFMQPNI